MLNLVDAFLLKGEKLRKGLKDTNFYSSSLAKTSVAVTL